MVLPVVEMGELAKPGYTLMKLGDLDRVIQEVVMREVMELLRGKVDKCLNSALEKGQMVEGGSGPAVVITGHFFRRSSRRAGRHKG